jgi:hypothetical protein
MYNAISFWNDKSDFCGFLADNTAAEKTPFCHADVLLQFLPG